MDVPDVPSAVENGFLLSSEQHRIGAGSSSAAKRKHEIAELATDNGAGAQLSNGQLSDAVARSLLAHAVSERDEAATASACDGDEESHSASGKRARLEIASCAGSGAPAPFNSFDSV